MKNGFKNKICQFCFREFEWRKKWLNNWDQVLYCSQKCQKSNNNEIKKYKYDILNLLKERGFSKTICPSEVLVAEDKKNKAKMEKVRIAARSLAAESLIIIQQKGKVIDPLNFKGPIRLKLIKSGL